MITAYQVYIPFDENPHPTKFIITGAKTPQEARSALKLPLVGTRPDPWTEVATLNIEEIQDSNPPTFAVEVIYRKVEPCAAASSSPAVD